MLWKVKSRRGSVSNSQETGCLRGWGHGSFARGLQKRGGILLVRDVGGHPSCSFHLDSSLRKRGGWDPRRAVGATRPWAGKTAWSRYRAGRPSERLGRLEGRKEWWGPRSPTHWACPSLYPLLLPQPIPSPNVHRPTLMETLRAPEHTPTPTRTHTHSDCHPRCTCEPVDRMSHAHAPPHIQTQSPAHTHTWLLLTDRNTYRSTHSC